MAPKPCIVIASLMRGNGPTGVETHFNLIRQAASAAQYPTEIVTPYSKTPLLQRACNWIANRWQRWSPESAHIWLRRIHRTRMQMHLRSAVRRHRATGVIVYAQDPLSAAVALELDPGVVQQVVCVVHFNISEADEFAAKGVTAPGGKLWQQLRATEGSVLPRVAKRLFVSNYMRNAVAGRIAAIQGLDNQVIANFTSIEINATTGRLTADAVCIGTLEPRKNQQYILHVIAACKARGFRYRLDVIGSGTDETMLRDLSKKLGIADQVRFLGFVRNAAAHLAEYRVLLHAASMESFGIVLLEAMARSVPVIAAPVGGVPEVFDDGSEGYFWDLADPQSGGDVLIKLLENAHDYARLQAAATARFERDYDPEQLAKTWLKAITQR